MRESEPHPAGASSAAIHELRTELAVRSDALPVALLVCDASEALVIREWNPAAERIFGYTRAEVLGRSPYDFLIPRQRKGVVRSILRKVRASTEAQVTTSSNITRDGRTITCEWHTAAVRDANGNVLRFVAMVNDITDRLIAQERQRLWSSLLEQTSEGIVICDPEHRILKVNGAFETLTGYGAEDAVGHTPRILRSGLHDGAFYRRMWESVERTGVWSGEIWNRRKDGHLYVEWLVLKAVYDTAGAVTHYLGIFSDITERKATEERARHLAHYDALTNLPNRSLTMSQLQQLTQAAGDGKLLGVLLLNLDRFRSVNESMGHEAGDILLQTVARRISSILRKADIVGRIGGDEFLILCPGLTRADGAASVARKLLEVASAPISVNSVEVSLSASIGICITPQDGETAVELVRNTTAALSRAKLSGRNCFAYYARQLHEHARGKLETASALRVAFDRGELFLQFQPQLDILSGAIVGAEALVRWNRAGVGLVPPDDFIPVAEEFGLMGVLGMWVQDEAIRQLRDWDVAGLPPLTVAVNVSANEFHRPGFVDRLLASIESCGLSPSRLELELTERVAIQDLEATVVTIERLRRSGIRVSLDDFGTGYSCLTYLHRLHVDKIKIDRSFVREMLVNEDSYRIVRAVIGLARSFQLKVVAEGVETHEQLVALKAESCDEFQGYFASVPLSSTEFERFVREYRATG